ncbi:MAG: ArsR family transcriptional regulator [Chthoniobacteraceae bacterium]
MKGRSFRERLLDSTRGQILSLLRTKPLTVNDLTAALNLTDNAVRAHLVSLERDGLVQRHGMEPGFRKPHVSYGLTADAEQVFPKAYGPLLNHFLETVSKRLTSRELNASMREVGRAVAREFIEALPKEARAAPLAGALEVLKELGGAATLHEEDGKQFIRGNNCPLSAITAHHPEACMIAESLLTELIGVPVKERCIHGARPRCCFEVTMSSGEGGRKR